MNSLHREPAPIPDAPKGGASVLPGDNHAELRMLGAIPGEPALGRGPVPDGDYSRHEYDHPAAGWGAARSVASMLEHTREPLEGARALYVMNHEDGGFDCPGCAWPDDPDGQLPREAQGAGRYLAPLCGLSGEAEKIGSCDSRGEY